jgi:glycerate kinase
MLLFAKLRPRSDVMNQYFGFDRLFEDSQWDLVVTAEGSIDSQSTQGKMTTEVARLAKRHGTPVVAVAGTIGEGAEGCYDAGIGAFTSIMKGPLSLEEALSATELLVKDGAEKVMRMIMIGVDVQRKSQLVQEQDLLVADTYP